MGEFAFIQKTSLDNVSDDRGYQVYLTNARAVFDMGHRVLKRSDPRFWGSFYPLEGLLTY